MVQDELLGIALLTPVPDHSAGALDNLAGLALLVKLGEANPLAELLALNTLDDADGVLLGKRLDKADVLSRVAVRGQDAKVSLTTVQGLDALAETAGNAIVHKGLLEGGLQVGEQEHISMRDYTVFVSVHPSNASHAETHIAYHEQAVHEGAKYLRDKNDSTLRLHARFFSI
jgi:hypothetical protein